MPPFRSRVMSMAEEWIFMGHVLEKGGSSLSWVNAQSISRHILVLQGLDQSKTSVPEEVQDRVYPILSYL